MCFCADTSLKITRRGFLQRSAAVAATVASLGDDVFTAPRVAAAQTSAAAPAAGPKAQTVLGPVSPDALGVTLMHEHAPVIDWSALYDQPMAPVQGAFRQSVIEQSVKGLEHFHGQLGSWAKTGKIAMMPCRSSTGRSGRSRSARPTGCT